MQGLQITGVEALVSNLGALYQKRLPVAKKAAFKAGGTIIAHLASLNAPRETGALAKAEGVKVTKNAAIIGPRSNFSIQAPGSKAKQIRKQVRKGLLAKRDELRRRPVRYAHLVEKGHGGPHPAGAHPFLEPALAQGAAGATAAMESVILAFISREDGRG